MKKYITSTLLLLLSANTLMAGSCSDLKVDFTFYGAKDKSYVVTKNTFTKMTVTGDKLLGSKVDIDLTSLDTSADLSNGSGKKWPQAMMGMRDRNTVNGLFKKFETGNTTAKAEIVKVNKDSVDVSITMNGITKKINMTTKVEGNMLIASGKLEITDFTKSAFTSFANACRGFHKGKSFSEIDLFFQVPSTCK